MTKTEAYENSYVFMGLTPKYGYKASKLYCYKPTDGTGDFTWARNSTAYRVNQTNFLELMGTNVPRIDHINNCPELLIEEERTNLLLWSDKYDESPEWSFYGVDSITSGQSDPYGTTTAFRITDEAINDSHYIYQNITTASTDLVGIVMAKAGTLDYIYLDLLDKDGVNHRTWFNVNDGTIGTNTDGNTAWISPKSINGYWVCAVYNSLNFSGAGGSFTIGLAENDGIVIYNGTNAYVDLGGSDFQVGLFPTSHILTTTTSATRLQDTNENSVAFTGEGFSFNLRVRIENRSDASIPDNLLFFADTSGIPDIYLGCYVLDNNLEFVFYNNPDIEYVRTPITDGIHNIGFSFNGLTGAYQVVLDGTSVLSGTLTNAYSLVSTYEKCLIGYLENQIYSPALNKVIGLQIYDSVLPSLDLINITS
jgi:hypothetical protein